MTKTADHQNNLGVAFMRHNRMPEAVAAFTEAARLAPTSAGAHCNLGSALLKMAQYEQALGAFQLAAGLQPDMTPAQMGIAQAMTKLGRISDAVAIYRQIIASSPPAIDAHIQLGHLFMASAAFESAIDCYQQALSQAPDRCDALGGLGSALMFLGRFDEAEIVLRRAVQLSPQSAAGWTNLGNVFRVQTRVDEALWAYEQAVAADPAFAPARANLGIVLLDRGKAEAAVAQLRRAIELDPSSEMIHSNLVYASCFCPNLDAGQLLAEARHWAKRHETPRLELQAPHAARSHAARLRVGYIGPDFRDHVVGRNVLPVIEHHDRAGFEIHCFSTVSNPDAVTERFKNAVDRWHDCTGMGDRQLAELIRGSRIDILVDLTLHMQGSRLPVFAARPAPVRVTWAGYPGTTGLSSMDFRITDPYLDPPGKTDEFYSEKSIRLPHSFWCYRPLEDSAAVNALPASAAGFVTFGCLNNFAKVTAAAVALWSDVLLAVPMGRMRILCPPGSIRQEIRDAFSSGAVDPARIDFADRGAIDSYLREYHRIDISLDPLPYTGHTTTLDSLWMGVPVVTLSGDTSVSRGSVTGLTHTGLADLIATAPAQYVSIAKSLANDLPRLAQIRNDLRQRLRASPICNEIQFTRDLEKAYRQMWREKGYAPPD